MLNELVSKIRSKRLLIDDLSPDTVMEMIECGEFGVNEKDNGDNTPMYYFSFLGRNDLVEKIIEMGADPNKGILIAASQGYYDIVKTLVKAGADVNIKNRDGDTPLMLAIYMSPKTTFWTVNDTEEDIEYLVPVSNYKKAYMDIIKYLIKNGANLQEKNKQGKTPLHLAVLYRRTEIVELLLKTGVEPNVKDNGGGTPLFDALPNYVRIKFDKDIFKMLLKYGADPNIKDNYGNMILFETLLENALELKEKIEVIEDLIEVGVDYTAKNSIGNTALHYAASIKSPELTKRFIELGLDVNAKNNKGLTPLLYACKINDISDSINTDVIKTLIEAGADVNVKDNNGKTPLFYLIYADNLEGIKLLIENGADPNIRDNNGDTPLLFDSKNDKINHKIFKTLVEAGADINAKDKEGKTPLYHRIKKFDDKGIEFLTKELKADVNVKDNDGNTPLLFAVKHHCRNFSAFDLLIEAGANVFEKNSLGETPLTFLLTNTHWMFLDPYVEKGLEGKDFQLEERKRVINYKEKYMSLLEYTLFAKDSKGDVVYKKTFYSEKMSGFYRGRYIDYIKPTKTILNEYEQICLLYFWKRKTTELMPEYFAISEIGYITCNLETDCTGIIYRGLVRGEHPASSEARKIRNEIKNILQKIEEGDPSIEIEEEKYKILKELELSEEDGEEN